MIDRDVEHGISQQLLVSILVTSKRTFEILHFAWCFPPRVFPCFPPLNPQELLAFQQRIAERMAANILADLPTNQAPKAGWVCGTHPFFKVGIGMLYHGLNQIFHQMFNCHSPCVPVFQWNFKSMAQCWSTMRNTTQHEQIFADRVLAVVEIAANKHCLECGDHPENFVSDCCEYIASSWQLFQKARRMNKF